MAFVRCKDCIYGDCFAGKNRNCMKFPSIGTAYAVTDDFFCLTTGKSRDDWKKENEGRIDHGTEGENPA